MNPEEARRIVRERHYGNRAEESLAIQSVDDQVFDKVRSLEQFMMGQADALSVERKDAIAEALAVSEELGALTKDVDRKRVRLDPATARKWQILNQRAEDASEALDRISRDIDHVEGKLSDPYGTYLALVERFSILKPDIHI